MTYPIMFHVTDQSNLPNIYKYGIKPSLNRDTKHGACETWLVANEEEAKRVLDLLRFNKDKRIEKPIVIKLDASKVRLYRFGNMKDYFTPDTIEPAKILGYRMIVSGLHWI